MSATFTTEFGFAKPTDAAPPRFEGTRQSWILSRYADVTMALSDSRFALHGALPASDMCASAHPHAHTEVRDATRHLLSAYRLREFQPVLQATAVQLATSLERGHAIDLMDTFAAPFGLLVAQQVLGLPQALARECVHHAREVFLAAATATSGRVVSSTIDSPHAAQTLATQLLTHARRAPNGSVDIGAVQTFVALTQTVPCLLIGSWWELLRHPRVVSQLRADPTHVPLAVNELLRLASPARAVFRVAREDVVLGNDTIRAGDQVVLMLAAANHDPLQFPNPGSLDVARNAIGHLAFGLGPHRCAGAALVRLALEIATDALLTHAFSDETSLVTQHPTSWIGGFAISAPATLPVVLRARGFNNRD